MSSSAPANPPAPFAVPVIDIAPFLAGGPDGRAAVAAAVDRAAREVGFMQITGHGIPAEAVRELTDGLDAFFTLPMTEKRRWTAPVGVNRGYSPPKSERLSYSLGVASPSDLFEAFNIGRQPSEFPELDLPQEHYEENVWPEGAEAFRTGASAWFGHAGRLARRMTEIFAVALGLPDDFFAAYTGHSVDVMRMNNYLLPEAETHIEPDQMGMGAHTDYGIVTVLWADAVRGLQVLAPDGVWHDVVPAPGALLVNLGDLLARWTNDRWISTMHRVLPPVDATGRLIHRRSAAFFHDGDYDALISCLPGCENPDGTTLYAPVTIGEHLAAKLGGSRGLTLNRAAEREAARLTAASGA